MAFLKIYEWEFKTYAEFREVKVKRVDSIKYFRKLSRKFKIEEPKVNLNSKKRGGGTYWHYSKRIDLPENTNLGTIIHEFTHHLVNTKTVNNQGHNKIFKRNLKIVYTYSKRYLKLKKHEHKKSLLSFAYQYLAHAFRSPRINRQELVLRVNQRRPGQPAANVLNLQGRPERDGNG